MTASVEYTPFRLFDPRVGRDVSSVPSFVRSMPIVWGSGVLSASVDCVFARPFPLVEVRLVFVDTSALSVDVACRLEDAVEEEGGDGDGDGGGLAYS
jgi:hypothetical protein